MKKLLLFVFVMVCYFVNGQVTRLHFDYDTAGNQIKRYLVFNSMSGKTTEEENFKDVALLKDKDLLKFSENDAISYYPNPVREELYLKWELINDNKVSSIEIFSMNGQLIKNLNNIDKENSKTISFEEYMSGTYLILMLYTNGEKKSITIIKK